MIKPYYETKLGKLYHGDCLEIMPELELESVDLVLTDPPYGNITPCKWDKTVPLHSLWTIYKKIIKKDSIIVLTAQQPLTSKLVISNIEMFRYEWIWDKYIPRGMHQAKYQPTRKHESVLIFSQIYPGKYFPIKIKLNKPVIVKNYTKNSKSIGPYKNNSKEYTYVDKYPNSIILNKWEANAKKVHATQKPISLFEYLIKTYTDKNNDLILDNFIGSGTTAIACERLKRKWIGIEIEEKYCEIAAKRIEENLTVPERIDRCEKGITKKTTLLF